MAALGDLIATVLRRKKPRVSPRGAKVARSTATQVRSSASDATETAIEATRKAKHTTERTARTARATGSSAKAGAERTVRAAQRGRHQHRTSRKGRRQGNGHLCPQVGQADSKHRQARRDHHWPHGSQGSHEHDQDRPARST